MKVLRVEQRLLTDASLVKDSTKTISSNDQVLSRERGSFWDEDDDDYEE